MVGGIGVCGLPLCCSTFLNEFDGISITRAKNQMLAINIPKLSGHCGKLICCLKYEDDAYSELIKDADVLSHVLQGEILKEQAQKRYQSIHL
jgi:cell fate regulator YaaT (PSP1 superfamily)